MYQLFTGCLKTKSKVLSQEKLIDGMSLVYSKNEKLINIPDLTNSGASFFRKYSTRGCEMDIVRIISLNQFVSKYLLKIYNINETYKYFDAEMLDMNYEDKTTLIDDIRKTLDLFHALNIIYVDLKKENMGYSHIDKCWKLIDFDSSGICDSTKTKWIKMPPIGFIKENRRDDLTTIDEVLYYFLFI